MSSDSAQDKQLPASARRLKQARDDGQAARSRDLAHFAVVAAALAVLVTLAPVLTGWLRELVVSGLRFDLRAATTPALMTERLGQLASPTLVMALGLGVVTGVAALAAALASGGWVFTFKPVMPDFGKINPLSGLGRIVSKAQIGEMLKACLLALVLVLVAGFYLWNHREDFARTQAMALPAAFAATGSRIASGLWLLVLVLAVAAVIDVPLQRFLHMSKLKMSRQEAKEEAKQQDGNQEVKAKMRQRMREMARRRMMSEVPGADLVVMNPTHYAVAIKYSEGSQGAPRVVAKGADLVALRIRDVAREAKVPVLRAPPLARALYASTDLEQEIPLALYSAVAQVLAHVFQLREAMAGRAPYPGSLPAIAVPAELDPHDPRHTGRAARGAPVAAT